MVFLGQSIIKLYFTIFGFIRITLVHYHFISNELSSRNIKILKLFIGNISHDDENDAVKCKGMRRLNCNYSIDWTNAFVDIRAFV